MSNSSVLRRPATLLALAALVLAVTLPASAANLILINLDPPGVGLNDPTPAAPVGGNPGTTIGEQRQITFQFAADLWGSTLDSAVPIFVLATFAPLPCSAASGVLGSAGPTFVFRDFANADFAGTWYHSALADQIAGADLNPGFGDLIAFFNASLDNNPNCLAGTNWYYGLDGNNGNDIDFLAVVTHEMGHGLGFSGFSSVTTGQLLGGLPDIYSVFTHDNTLAENWNQMTDAERLFSVTNAGNVVWDGASVAAKAPSVLGSLPTLTVNAPAGIAGTYAAQAAAFGPALTTGGTTGDVVLVDDGVGTGTDACEPLANGGAVSGNIALIDRGGCSFTAKVLNAQAAGAVGAIVANNQPGGPAPMGGFDANVAIPSVGITQADGSAIKGELPGVNVTFGLDPNLLSGADANGLALLYTPATVAPGSSLSHFDTSATPNLLMEPFISADLNVAQTLDLTPFLMEDVGWQLTDTDGDGFADVCDACQNSDLSATVVIDGCDSGAANAVLDDGCSISDLIAGCVVGAGNHGDFVSCVSELTNELKAAGTISGRDKGKITSCAARSSLP